MIRHMVLLNLHSNTDAELERLFQDIHESLGRLPGVKNFRIGKAIDQASQYGYMLSMDFENREALAQYMAMHSDFAHDRLMPAMREWMGKLNYETIT